MGRTGCSKSRDAVISESDFESVSIGREIVCASHTLANAASAKAPIAVRNNGAERLPHRFASRGIDRVKRVDRGLVVPEELSDRVLGRAEADGVAGWQRPQHRGSQVLDQIGG